MRLNCSESHAYRRFIEIPGSVERPNWSCEWRSGEGLNCRAVLRGSVFRPPFSSLEKSETYSWKAPFLGQEQIINHHRMRQFRGFQDFGAQRRHSFYRFRTRDPDNYSLTDMQNFAQLLERLCTLLFRHSFQTTENKGIPFGYRDAKACPCRDSPCTEGMYSRFTGVRSRSSERRGLARRA